MGTPVNGSPVLGPARAFPRGQPSGSLLRHFCLCIGAERLLRQRGPEQSHRAELRDDQRVPGEEHESGHARRRGDRCKSASRCSIC